MRQFFSVLFCFATLSFVPSLLAETIWESSIKKGLERSKSENKPILIDLYADWCGYCKVLEKEIFPDKEVEKVLEGFVTVRLNGEEFPNLMQKYGIEGYPTILYIDQYSNFLTKITGLSTKKTILDTSQKVLASPDLEIVLKNELNRKPNSSSIQFRLGTYYYHKKDFENAKVYLKLAADSEIPKDKSVQEDALFNLSLIHVQMEDWKQSASSWKSFLDKYPKSKNSVTAELCYGLSLKEVGEKKLAKKILTEVRPRLDDPEDIHSVDEALEAIRKGF
ncbi:tetratricopeptide repeat protein [Leptospira idonii]|uniref:DUF3808 domain-containing protein n=1 Tax=Leptospira idonii TaxID=1193500 RepID=A0A4V3JXZ5_9LEPT|nr:tetratricopeptide repeat protein [Leptospira idonii]TGN19206.1 DUF3808 domain-containing protein [Leptospira idonii]